MAERPTTLLDLRPSVAPINFGQTSTSAVHTDDERFQKIIKDSAVLRFPGDPNDYTLDIQQGLRDEGEIGRGNFGSVSRMQHLASGRFMAVKRIRSTAVSLREQKQIVMELEPIMRAETCVNIVRFYGAAFHEGDCWICMELMDLSLENCYRTVYNKLHQRLPEYVIGHMIVSTVTALDYLKEQLKVIHRDVKPSNILLHSTGECKLCDFGISGQLVDSIAKTQDAGCRPYMAPERLSGPVEYDVRSDVWSLGITLVEITTGRFPYSAWRTVFEQVKEVVQGEPPLLGLREEEHFYSQDMIDFVNACLTKDKKARPKYRRTLEDRAGVRGLINFPFFEEYNEPAKKSITLAQVGVYVSEVLKYMPQREEAVA